MKPSLVFQITDSDLKIQEVLFERLGMEGERPFKLSGIRYLFEPLINHIDGNKTKVLTIGGTNGKGETSFWVDDYLRSKALNTSRWISPHIETIRERFQFKGDSIEKNDFVSLLNEVIQYLGDEVDILSFYEFLFFTFLYWNVHFLKVDHIILEVGLGGRLDAVNLLNPTLCSIVSVSRDHQHILGATLKKILHEKLGISRSERYLLTSLELMHLRSTVFHFNKKRKAKWLDLFDGGLIKKSDPYTIRNQKLAWLMVYLVQFLDHRGRWIGPLNEKKVLEDLHGAICSQESWAEDFNSDSRLAPLVLKEYAEGKKETQKVFYFNGAHNCDAIRKMLSYYIKLIPKKRSANSIGPFNLLVAFSSRDVSDIKTMLNSMTSMLPPHLIQKIFLYEFQGKKAFKFSDDETVSKAFEKNDTSSLKLVHIYNLKTLLDSRISENFLVTGSNYFIGEFRLWLKNLNFPFALS